MSADKVALDAATLLAVANHCRRLSNWSADQANKAANARFISSAQCHQAKAWGLESVAEWCEAQIGSGTEPHQRSERVTGQER